MNVNESLSSFSHSRIADCCLDPLLSKTRRRLLWLSEHPLSAFLVVSKPELLSLCDNWGKQLFSFKHRRAPHFSSTHSSLSESPLCPKTPQALSICLFPSQVLRGDWALPDPSTVPSSKDSLFFPPSSLMQMKPFHSGTGCLANTEHPPWPVMKKNNTQHHLHKSEQQEDDQDLRTQEDFSNRAVRLPWNRPTLSYPGLRSDLIQSEPQTHLQNQKPWMLKSSSAAALILTVEKEMYCWQKTQIRALKCAPSFEPWNTASRN